MGNLDNTALCECTKILHPFSPVILSDRSLVNRYGSDIHSTMGKTVNEMNGYYNIVLTTEKGNGYFRLYCFSDPSVH